MIIGGVNTNGLSANEVTRLLAKHEVEAALVEAALENEIEFPRGLRAVFINAVCTAIEKAYTDGYDAGYCKAAGLDRL